jgi:hypothetical protein
MNGNTVALLVIGVAVVGVVLYVASRPSQTIVQQAAYDRTSEDVGAVLGGVGSAIGGLGSFIGSLYGGGAVTGAINAAQTTGKK